MENQKLSHWVIISVLSMLFCLLIYTLTGEFTPKAQFFVLYVLTVALPPSPGVYGFMTFGRAVASDILMSYQGNDVVMIISRLLFGISIITIYPIILLLGRSANAAQWSLLCIGGFLCVCFLPCCVYVRVRSVLLNLMLRVQRHRRGIVTHSFESRCRVVLTMAWITLTLLIAMFVPDMGDVISVIGGISAFFIFIFPGRNIICIYFCLQNSFFLSDWPLVKLLYW